MKKALFLGCIFIAFAAAGQGKATRTKLVAAPATPETTQVTTAPAPTTVAPKWYNKHLRLGLALSTSTDLKDAKFTDNRGQAVASGDLGTSGGMGLNLQYQRELNPTFDWFAGMTYYREREISSFRGARAGGAVRGDFKLKPTYQPWVLSSGVQYKVNDYVYLPVGLNYTLLNQTGKGDFKTMDMGSMIGYQAGVGAQIERVNIELVTQSINYDLKGTFDDNSTIAGSVKNEGLALTGRYIF